MAPARKLEWARAGLTLPDLAAMRRHRLARVRQQLRQADYAGIVRYATDSTNMQVWLLHNASRYVFVPADGPVVLWEFDHCDFLSGHTDSVDEIRAMRCAIHACEQGMAVMRHHLVPGISEQRL